MLSLGVVLVLAAACASVESANATHQNFIESSFESLSLLPESLDLFNINRLHELTRVNVSAVSGECRDNLETYFAGLRNKETWAMRIVDASGSYGSGYLFGDRFWLGSQTECLDLPNHIGSPPPFPVHFFSAKYQVHHNVTTHFQVILVGLCLPAACAKTDLNYLLNATSPTQASFETVRPVPDNAFNLYLETPFLVLAIIVAIAALIVFIGTLYEIYLGNRKHRTLTTPQAARNKQIAQNSNATAKAVSGPLQFYNQEKATRSNSISSAESTSSVHSESSCDSQQQKPGNVGKILLCFSLKRNLKKICDTRGLDSLGCVHGLRVFSLIWVVAGHTCMITVPFVDNIGFRLVVERDFLFQSIGNGAFSVDSFFFLSGLLIAFVFHKSEKSYNGEQSPAVHAKTSTMKLIGGITYRLIRLTPPYVVIMVLSYLIARWFLHNSIFDPPMADFMTCPQYWWRNLLYINTLFPVNQMCVIWSWYLADDTQFYVIGLIILLVSTRYNIFASVATSVLLIISWATTAVITLQTNHRPSVEEPLGLFDQLYDKPWTRFGPYVVGMAVGYYLAKINCQATYHKAVVVTGWVLSTATTFVLVFGIYGELTPLQSAAYVALSHTAWALALSWVVIACVTGYGGLVDKILSLKPLAPLSRLSYCAYLVHPLIMISTVSHMDGPAHLQRDTMIIMMLGYIMAAYLGSLVLTLLFEAPAVALLSIFHPLKKKTEK